MWEAGPARVSTPWLADEREPEKNEATLLCSALERTLPTVASRVGLRNPSHAKKLKASHLAAPQKIVYAKYIKI
jgi:hypothetical protein